MINPQRLRVARELQALTQTEVATRVGVEQSAISQAERGIMTPSHELVERLALVLKVPTGFFSQPPLVEFPEGSLAYRRTAQMTGGARASARRHAELQFELVQHMLERLDWPEHRLPRTRENSPEQAARITRSQLGFAPDAPVDHLVRSLERAGALVLLLPIPLDGGDGFSTWVGKEKRERPVIVLGASLSGDRFRFSTGHEVGHTVQHQAPYGSVPEIERDADSFAAELLMPAEAMFQQIERPVSLRQLGILKATWKVSIQALVRRAKDLGICTDRQYRYLCEQIGALGWRTSEPGNILVERPRALRQMAEVLYGSGVERKVVDYSKLAAELHLAPAYVREVLEMYAGTMPLGEDSLEKLRPGNTIVSFEKRRA